MKKIILLYSDKNEPISHEILKNYSQIENFHSISLEDLLKNIEIYDVVDNGIAELNWTLPSGVVLKNTNDTFLINRVLGIDEKLFEDFVDEDKTYAKEEFSAYISFAIEAFPNKTSASTYLGFLGPHYPLPLLWKKVNESNAQLKTPEYFYGPKALSPLKENVVQKDMFQHGYWRLGAHHTVSEDNIVFQCVRPKGSPVFVFSNSISSYLSSNEINNDLKNKIENICFNIHKNLGYFYSEALFFVDGEQNIEFASMSPYVFAKDKHENFEFMLKESFERIQELI